MKKLSAFIFFMSAAAFSVSAQRRITDKPNAPEWDDKPVVHPVPPQYANEHAIIILDDNKLDFRREASALNMYHTLHRIVKVLDHAGIEEFNTIEIPHWYGQRIPLIRARTILPNGTVKEISKDMILTSQDGSGNYKVIIAMEGVEKNAEIELLLKEITPADYFGNHYFQYSMPVLESDFDISYPKDLSFVVKSYNGYPAAKEYLANNRKHITVSVADIPPLKREPYSFPSLHRMHAEYHIKDFATDYDQHQEVTWDSLSKSLHNYAYKISPKEKKAVNDFLADLGVTLADKEMDKIRKIENGIKTKVTLYQVVDYDERKEVLASKTFRSLSLYDVNYYDQRNILDSIIEKKSASSTGYIKLFAACFVQAGVKHELGLGTDHESYLPDENFPNLDEMNYPLFYFPDQQKYLAPTNAYLRCPFVPEEVTSNKAIFSTIPPVERKGDVTTGTLYKIRTVKPLPANETHTNVSANVTFTKDMDAQIDVAYSYSGYEATDIRTRLSVLKDKELQEYTESLIRVADKKEDVVKYTLSNEGLDKYYGNKPLEVYASVTTSRLTEKAGPKYLINIGEVIGKQKELYSEDKRVMPVDLAYPHSATHTISVNIPKGYKASNLEALRTKEDFVNDNLQPVMGFSSDYKLEGDKLVITVSEYYTQLHFPVSEYDRFRKVINKAADFSKAKIVLEKGHMAITKPKAKKKVAA